MEEELKFIFESAEEAMSNAVKHLEKKLLNIRAGKANTSMLGSIVVEYYGALNPRLAFIIAFSISANKFFSQGCTTIVLPSGVLTLAT